MGENLLEKETLEEVKNFLTPVSLLIQNQIVSFIIFKKKT